jgi:SAM-dependent methyltransferase
MNTWDGAYRADRPPPWDIGRAQPEFERLAETGEITGRVIDVGCGTGENALMLAARRLSVVGVDVAATAIERAREKAAQRGLAADFRVWDALALHELVMAIGTFACAIDSGVFHTFADEDRPRYADSVASAVEPRGRLFLMCFNEHEPDWGGPRRVTQEDLRATFSPEAGWSVEEIRAARFATNHPEGSSRAWLAAIRRI